MKGLLEFQDISLWEIDGSMYHEYGLVNPGRWNMRDESHFNLAIF